MNEISNVFNYVKSEFNFMDIASCYSDIFAFGEKSEDISKGICEFCKSYSFMVNCEQNIFFCYDCKSGGDIITFVGKLLNLSPIDSVKEIISYQEHKLPEEYQHQLDLLSEVIPLDSDFRF